MAVNLWDKGVAMDPRVRAFTVGEDVAMDRVLLPWDLAGSAAHAKMLASIGALAGSEAASLVRELRAMRDAHAAGQFTVADSDEDCHTAIENRLTEKLGPLGGKIHLGRSRNDQVVLALRLWMRDAALELCGSLGEYARAQLEFAERHAGLPLPGHTHLQAAMPSSWALWAQAWVEAALESMRALRHLYSELNRCPLGAAAGFGSPVATDRAFVSHALGFDAPQRSVVDVIHSRARLEGRLLHEIAVVGASVEKFACDASLYLTREFGYLRLDPAFQTGSSIMPQKQNPDVVELLRARAARLRARQEEHAWVAAKLPSNYHRDYQLLKEPLLRGLGEALEVLEMAALLPAHVEPVEERLRAALTPDLDAAREASERALAGTPFREAYRETAAHGVIGAAGAASAGPGTSRGLPEHVRTAAAAELRVAAVECAALEAWIRGTRGHFREALERVFE
ncbi:MAG: argininosuccinate lyase [Candidatus Eisenbacteria bacterium]|nr:argininosuccinate lyase [Candidatus Eisenbacteria bacterium]